MPVKWPAVSRLITPCSRVQKVSAPRSAESHAVAGKVVLSP